jgi:hypothetical protein
MIFSYRSSVSTLCYPRAWHITLHYSLFWKKSNFLHTWSNGHTAMSRSSVILDNASYSALDICLMFIQPWLLSVISDIPSTPSVTVISPSWSQGHCKNGAYNVKLRLILVKGCLFQTNSSPQTPFLLNLTSRSKLQQFGHGDLSPQNYRCIYSGLHVIIKSLTKEQWQHCRYQYFIPGLPQHSFLFLGAPRFGGSSILRSQSCVPTVSKLLRCESVAIINNCLRSFRERSSTEESQWPEKHICAPYLQGPN